MTTSANILIIDDELGSRESLRMILKPSYQVFTAGNGREAMEIIRRSSIDLVTLDLRMPSMHGSDVLRAIKEHDPDIEVVIVTGYGTLKSATEAIRQGVFDYILKPFNVAEIMSVVKRSVEKRHLNRKKKEIISELEAVCISDRGEGRRKPEVCSEDKILFSSVEDILVRPAAGYGKEGSVDYLEFVRVLAATLEINDPYTHGHSDRVHYYCSLMGHHLEFTPQEAESLQIAAFLHDIGKIGVSNACIQKAGKLTDNERDLVRRHPEKGAELVGPLRLPSPVDAIIRHHHERYDGKGYPSGLAREDIPLCARIIGIADAFDAMTSNRPYRRALPRGEVIAELIGGKRTQFDPVLVDLFIGILESESFTPFGSRFGSGHPN